MLGCAICCTAIRLASARIVPIGPSPTLLGHRGQGLTDLREYGRRSWLGDLRRGWRSGEPLRQDERHHHRHDHQRDRRDPVGAAMREPEAQPAAARRPRAVHTGRSVPHARRTQPRSPGGHARLNRSQVLAHPAPRRSGVGRAPRGARQAGRSRFRRIDGGSPRTTPGRQSAPLSSLIKSPPTR